VPGGTTGGINRCCKLGEEMIPSVFCLIDFPLKQLDQPVILGRTRSSKTALRMSDFGVDGLQFHPLK